jgi:hypothetical protein
MTLLDIIEYGEQALACIEGGRQGHLDKDLRLRFAVFRALGVFGEAAARIPPSPGPSTQKSVAGNVAERVRMIPNYGNTPTRSWTKYIPGLGSGEPGQTPTFSRTVPSRATSLPLSAMTARRPSRSWTVKPGGQ